jgi:hypothetical protein
MSRKVNPLTNEGATALFERAIPPAKGPFVTPKPPAAISNLNVAHYMNFRRTPKNPLQNAAMSAYFKPNATKKRRNRRVSRSRRNRRNSRRNRRT